MHLILFIAGIIIAAFGIYKYTAIKRREPRFFNFMGIHISEEIIWMAVFLLGFILIIDCAIHRLEPHFLSKPIYHEQSPG